MGKLFMLLAQFEAKAAASTAFPPLLALYKEFRAYVGSPEFEPSPAATPVHEEFARVHGFEWPEQDGFLWENMQEEERGLSLDSTDRLILISHENATGIGIEGFRRYLTKAGATRLIGEEVVRAVISARNEAAQTAIGLRFEEGTRSTNLVRDLDDGEAADDDAISFEFVLNGGQRRYLHFDSTDEALAEAVRFLQALFHLDDVDIDLARPSTDEFADEADPVQARIMAELAKSLPADDARLQRTQELLDLTKKG